MVVNVCLFESCESAAGIGFVHSLVGPRRVRRAVDPLGWRADELIIVVLFCFVVVSAKGQNVRDECVRVKSGPGQRVRGESGDRCVCKCTMKTRRRCTVCRYYYYHYYYCIELYTTRGLAAF